MLYAMLSMLRSSLSYVFDVRSTCFHVSYHVFVPRSIFPMCCLDRSTCFYARLHVYFSFLHALCFMPCLESTCSHAWYHVYGYALLRSTCWYACSVLLCLCLCLHMLVCLGLHSPMPLCYIYMLRCISTCLLCISMLICVDRCVYMLRLMFSTCFMSSSMCLCASRHVYVLSLDLVCHAMCYCSHFVPFIAFFFCVFGLMVRTRSGPYGICHRPYTKAHIKGFGSPLFACLCLLACLLLCFMLVLASLVLGFATLDALSGFMVVWLHPMPMRSCLDVTTWNVSPWYRLLRAHLSPFLLHAMVCLPCLFVPPIGFLCIFTRLLTCSCMSLAC